MSDGRLGFYKSVSTALNNVYQCPVGKYAKVVVNVAAEVTGSVKVRLYVSPTASPTTDHIIQVETLNSISTGFVRTALILTSGEYLSFDSASAGVTVSVNGREFLTNNNELSVRQNVTTNTEVVLYEVPLDAVATVNATVTGLGAAVTSIGTAKLYVSTSNASGGGLMYSTSINSAKTGFEYTGLILSAGQKLILVTTGIIGGFSTRVQGFKGVA